jgi:ketosteroid isomerase-like protein
MHRERHSDCGGTLGTGNEIGRSGRGRARHVGGLAGARQGGTLATLADGVVFALFVPQEVLPFGGETRGKPSVSDRLQMILDQFDTLMYEGKVTRTQGKTVYGRVAYRFRHKVTGEAIDGCMRQVIEVCDGLIVQLSEYHDIELVRAFMRLVSHAAAEQRIGR